MDQQKTGSFLKELRREKGLTQEQLAEEFNTTNRSVSRWENGRNLPDISLLVELADFYDVDVRELIDGERKSEMMDEEVREVASKMADYADEQRSRLLIWVRRISLAGVILMAVVLALQTFGYEPGVVSFICYALSVVVFIVMVILALHTNGMLEKLVKRKSFITGCKVLVAIAGVAVLSFVVRVFLVVALVIFAESVPFQNQSGIENYNKTDILENYGGDINGGLFIFPDDTDDMIDPTFVSSLKTGLFDTDGYIILQAKYDKEAYETEIERLSNIECSLSFSGETVTRQVRYDEASYALPAYITVDGFDNVYEYALINEETCEIKYILLSYPEFVDLSEYQEYLKLDSSEYEIEDSLNRFSIYSNTFDGGASWMEYSDEN